VQKGIEILQREYKTAKRENYLPQIQAFGEYDKNNIIREPWGKGGGGQVDQYWKAGVAAVLPLVNGGETTNTIRQKDSQIKSTEYQKTDLENSIDQSVAQQFAVLLSNYVQTYTTKIAAENAIKNLNIVKNLYAQGSVTITDLIDAKNSALTGELNEVIANYNLLGSAVGLEKLYGDYLILKSPLEQEELLNQLTSLMEK
ncbi:MAG: TolC family protein, partial [Cetobacterium sp.]